MLGPEAVDLATAARLNFSKYGQSEVGIKVLDGFVIVIVQVLQWPQYPQGSSPIYIRVFKLAKDLLVIKEHYLPIAVISL